jgi:hypothetical protein
VNVAGAAPFEAAALLEDTGIPLMRWEVYFRFMTQRISMDIHDVAIAKMVYWNY